MFFHIILTDECNLQCRYCYGQAFEDSECQKADNRFSDVPSEISYSIEKLIGFLEKEPDATITFYGGEPTLRPDLIKEIMDRLPDRRYMMQTNGVLLKNIGVDYLKRFHTLLISADGKPSLTNDYRGTGVFSYLENNISWLRSQGFGGEIIARMTVMEDTDIFESVTWLLESGLFDSVHWQLNANFWNDLGKRDFKKWSEENYNLGVKKLVKWWLEEIKKGKVHKIYPFLGVLDLILNKRDAPGILCGAGHSNFAIGTDGKIYPCPVMSGLKDFVLGDLDSEPKSLISKYTFKECTECDDYKVCGGRCMYGNYLMPWKKEGHTLVCETTKSLIVSLKSVVSEIEKLIENGIIKKDDFNFVWYNGAEIIP